MWVAVRSYETSVDNQFTRQYNPEDSSEHILGGLPGLMTTVSRFRYGEFDGSIMFNLQSYIIAYCERNWA
jgi:hypothetical protein